MKESMEVFGQALLDFSRGSNKKFFFQDSKWNKFEHPLRKYFRSYKDFNNVERKIVSLSKGKILDVGCATGHYIPYLMKKGNVLGIDISHKAIAVAKEKYNLKNVIVADIFNFHSNKRFDTIILLENNLGMAGTVLRTKKLLKILSSLLKTNGQILTDCRKVKGKNNIFNGELTPIWKENKGKKFKWISFNQEFLSKICDELKLNLKIIDTNRYHYLARITKN